MATTSFGVSHPLAVKIWSRKLFQEALKQTWASKFIGKGSNAGIQLLEEPSKGPGDTVHYGLRMLLSGAGIEGDSTLEGSEEALTFYRDTVVLNQLRHAVKSEGKMSEQRVPYSVREEAMQGLADWWSDRIDTALISQLTGDTGQTDTRYTGHNATVAPSTGHSIIGAASNVLRCTAEASISASTQKFTLNHIDAAVELAKTSTPMIRPFRVDGADRYVIIVHPWQVTDMRTSTTTGQWNDIQMSLIQGGKSADNPIFTGALGMYNNTIIHESTRIPLKAGSTADTVRRAVFFGAQAGVIAYGQGAASGNTTWVEELFDFKNKLGVAAGMIWGCKKSIFNSLDYGTITISTRAVAGGHL